MSNEKISQDPDQLPVDGDELSEDDLDSVAGGVELWYNGQPPPPPPPPPGGNP